MYESVYNFILHKKLHRIGKRTMPYLIRYTVLGKSISHIEHETISQLA